MDKIDRRDFIKTVGAGTVVTGLGSSLKAAQVGSGMTQKPNVVVVFCDQLRKFALGCYGNRFVKTPNIDRLAQNGFLFTHGISNSPTCVPARSNLLTGQYCRTCVGSRINEMTGKSHAFGRNDRLKHPDRTLPEQFKRMGYHTALIGKWHVDTRPSLMGFDESMVTGGSVYTRGSLSRNEGKFDPVTGFTTDGELSAAKEFFTVNKNMNRPFFLYYNIVSPHMPLLDVPYKYSHMYDPEDVPLRENVWKNSQLPRDEMWFHIYMWQTTYNRGKRQPITARTSSDFDLKDLTALYYGSVSWVDDTVGELLSSLKENGLDENTIIVFSSDHGDLLGSHHLWNKARLYEEAISIPMIYSWPGKIKPGSNDSQVASLIDVMPTLLDLCGGDIPETVHGQSLKPVLVEGKSQVDRNYTFVESSYQELGIRTPTHMYGVRLNKQDTAIEKEQYQFYDLRNDPYEMNNLAGSSRQSALAEELLQKTIRWDRETPRLKGLHYQAWAG